PFEGTQQPTIKPPRIRLSFELRLPKFRVGIFAPIWIPTRATGRGVNRCNSTTGVLEHVLLEHIALENMQAVRAGILEDIALENVALEDMAHVTIPMRRRQRRR